MLFGGGIPVFLAIVATQVTAAPSAALGYTPKYPADYRHFDYVNPKAPRGGEIVLESIGTFDNLNPYVLKGISAAGISQLMFEPLMVQSQDEPYSVYAHLAEDISLAKDRLSVTFRLNPKARFSDGSPVEAADVKHSFDTLISDKAHPQYRFYWADVKRAVVVDRRTIRFEFSKVNPELHLITAQMPVFSRKWGQGKDFDKISLDMPLASGPYVIEKYDLGKNITYRFNPDYWARDLPSRRGMFNYDSIQYKYYKDNTVRLEAFKAGEFDFIWENYSKLWARDYDGPPFASGKIKKELIQHSNNAGMQGFVFNLRRPLFQDQRVRRALVLAFDFHWSNNKLFYGQYTRCDSYFSNSELAASGLPSPQERALLEPHREQLSPAVFKEAWFAPTTEKSGDLRRNLREAKKLLAAAGWKVKDGALRNVAGEPFRFEVMLVSEGFQRILAPYARNLQKLGIEMTYRTVDSSLYKRRLDKFDYDMVVWSYGQSQSPGNELMSMWHSSTANAAGSQNIMGLDDPVVDALIEKVIYAANRQQLVTATRALDRVLLHGDYLVPNWYIASHRIAYWEKFRYPKKLPLYFNADSWMLQTWWLK